MLRYVFNHRRCFLRRPDEWRTFPKTDSSCLIKVAAYIRRALPPWRVAFQFSETKRSVKIFSGTSNRPLAEAIAKNIGIELGHCTVSSFPDGETFVKIEENVRGEDVFLVQSTCPPTNHNLMEMFILIDA